MAAENGNNNGTRLSLVQIIGGTFAIMAVLIGFLFNYTSAAHEAIGELRDKKLDCAVFQSCKIDLTLNQTKMEARIMARLDKIDASIESQTREKLRALEEQLRGKKGLR